MITAIVSVVVALIAFRLLGRNNMTTAKQIAFMAIAFPVAINCVNNAVDPRLIAIFVAVGLALFARH